jgi:hypothetical protein
LKWWGKFYKSDTLDDRIVHVQLYKSGEDWSGGGNFIEMELVTTDEGRVKRPEIYLVTDDLVIEPWLSPISSLCLLNRFKTPLDDLEEKFAPIGIKEVNYKGVKTILCLCTVQFVYIRLFYYETNYAARLVVNPTSSYECIKCS